MLLKKFWRKFTPNPFEKLLEAAKRKGDSSFLICWNRGLGDIALGLYAMVVQIKKQMPHAKITFITRSDLAEGFSLLPDVQVIVDPRWKRKELVALDKEVAKSYDVVIEEPDPSYWVKWQIGTLIPRLNWYENHDALWQKFAVPAQALAVHVQTETRYGTQKNWPVDKWQQLFDAIAPQPIVLFGFHREPRFLGDHIIDLRGKTTLLEMFSIIKNRCKTLLAPDSGVVSLTYYLNQAFPLNIVSLWADPRQGVLKQNVSSPNPLLVHAAILAPEENMSLLSVQKVLDALL